MAKQKLVVIGNGMAGARAVEEVFARGGAEQFEITMFGDEPYGNYNRIMLSNILSGIQDTSEIFINPLEWYAENNVRLHSGCRVTDIDRPSRVVVSDTGIKVNYDVLLIATGSRAFIPPMDGARMPDGSLKDGVFGFRTLDDCTGIIARAKKSRKAAVIGGGLLGLEAARGLLNHGCEVHLIHIGGQLMPAQLDSQGAALLLTAMQKMGVTIHLHKSTTGVLGEDSVTGLVFKDGTPLQSRLRNDENLVGIRAADFRAGGIAAHINRLGIFGVGTLAEAFLARNDDSHRKVDRRLGRRSRCGRGRRRGRRRFRRVG